MSPEEQAARADPLFRPLSIPEVVARTRRSRRTVDRWIKDGRLRTIDLGYPPTRVAILRDVVQVERETRQAAARGRPRKPVVDTPQAEAS